MERIFVWAGLITWLIVPAPAQESTLTCLAEIELPRFATSVLVPQGGHVVAVVRVGPEGQPEAISADATDANLSAEVEYHLRKKAQYRRDCSGRVIKLEFTFKVEGQPLDSPYPIVRFRPPNHFIIITQPAKSTPDFIPIPNEKKSDEKKSGKK